MAASSVGGDLGDGPQRVRERIEVSDRELFAIGDAASPRMWAAATYEGHMFARAIGEPGAPTNIGEAYFREFEMSDLPYPADMKFG